MKTSFFTNLFPPPRYLTLPALGLDISYRSFKYVELFEKRGKILIGRFGGHLIPTDIIEGGVIKNKQKLVDILKSLKTELGSKYIVSALPEEKAFLARVKLPLMKEEEIRGALELKLEECIPLSLSEAIFDYSLTQKRPESDHLDVYLIAFPRKIVEDYREAFREAGFVPLALEMEIQASVRTIVPRDEEGTVIIVDFGRTRTTFGIVSNNDVQFTTTIKVAGDDLEKALMKNLGVDCVEAEKIKIQKGFIRGKENEEIFNALLPSVSVIKDEIGKCVSYWNSSFAEQGLSPVSRIILCGGDSNLYGLPEYLSYELRLPVELGNPWVNIVSFEDYVPKIELSESLSYSIALGLALRSLNFY